MIVAFGAILIAACTWFGAPTLGPILAGFMIGLAWPDRSVRSAGAAALIAWGALLLYGWIRGTDLVALSSSLGQAMSLPSWALVVATLLYPVALATSAAWIGHVITPRQFFFSSKPSYRPGRR
jgi:hypothetical protein